MKSPDAGAGYREVRFEQSASLAPTLEEIGASLLISTYQAGKLVVVGVHQKKLSLSFHNFDRPMGVAARSGSIAVGCRRQVWFLKNAADVAPRIEPPGSHDACYLARSAHVTGEIHAHEVGWSGNELWLINTLFSCLCTLDGEHSFVPRWRPPFISKLAAEDRCHLNGLATLDGRPRFVTALAETDTPEGWRPNKATSGILIDVQSAAIVARGFAMPHSPRLYQDRLWLLDSGLGRLVQVDAASGKVDSIAELPGYTRGLAFHGPFAFIGLSKIRETSTFGGLPIADRRQSLKCGVAVLDLRSGRLAATIEFLSGVEEIFDVTVLPGIRHPLLQGPFAAEDGAQTIWTVPIGEPGIPMNSRPPAK